MFTGLIEATARIEAIDVVGAGRRLRIRTPLGVELSAGESVAVNGVCLTAVDVGPAGFAADVSPETVRVTTLGALHAGHLVNLERSLRADARIGGHFVLGHVDGIGRLASWRDDGDSAWVDIEFPANLGAAVVSKGSIAVDGVSLTIAVLEADRFAVQIVPFTRTHTAFADAHPGNAVNLETDILGKYVLRYAEMTSAANLRTL